MNPTRIDRAVAVLRAGGLVAFPTETVYGLGADATKAQAVRRIFAAKGRPDTNPLIVHVADEQVARRYAAGWPDEAARLARRFWPGPLTLVAPRGQQIRPEVTAGLETVGLRAPDHPLALELLRAFDGPLAAPSANRSGRISPTTAEHVRHELGEAVELILDGGACKVGIESTVLDLTRGKPAILRPGAVTQQQIEQVIGPVELLATSIDLSRPARSPGQQAVHYSPTTPAFRFQAGDASRLIEWLNEHSTEMAAVLLIEGSGSLSDARSSTASRHLDFLSPDPQEFARELYAALRRADAVAGTAIFIELPPPTPQWAAVRDRILRATRPLSDLR